MLDIPELDTLDQAEVSAVFAQMTQRVKEYIPNLDAAGRGVIKDIVVQVAAILQQACNQVIENDVYNSISLRQIADNPDTANGSFADALAENMGMTRISGEKASGILTVVMTSLAPASVPAGSVFSSNGLNYQADASYQARINENSLISPTDVLVTERPDGKYQFTFGVVASEVGSRYTASQGAVFSSSVAIPNLQSVSARDTFSAGVDEETDTALAERVLVGSASKAPSSRPSIASMVQQALPNVVAVSSVGMGDAEQQRYHSLFPIHFGGRADVYVRTQSLIQQKIVTKAARLVSKDDQVGTWQISITREDAPGFYRLRKVVLAGADASSQVGYELASTIRGYDVSSDSSTDLIPDVASADEAAFSAYSTAVARFVDTDTDVTDLALLSEQDYDIVFDMLPDVDTVQSALSAIASSSAYGDTLVKAAVPVLVTIDIEVSRPYSQEDPDLDAIALAVSAAVNATGFTKSVSASTILSAVVPLLPAGQYTSALDMTGTLLRPDGTSEFYRSSSLLSVAEQASRMVTKNTVCFFLSPEDVNISVNVIN